MVRNSEKRKLRKDREFKELDIQLNKGFFCGSCSQGFVTLEEYKEHCGEKEHEFHIERRIKSLVPGVGFCAACSCLIQNTQGWETHIGTFKHKACIQSLAAIEIFGSFDLPLGCQDIGKVGKPIDPTGICQKESTKHGNGHGGKLCKWSNLIGLNNITELGKDESGQQFNYNCDTCDQNFTFEHRGSHLNSLEHRMNHLKLHYPEWHEEINAIDKDFITRRTLKALWYAYQIEKMEADQETATAKALRKKFFNESTQRKEQNKTREPRETDRSSVQRGRGMAGRMRPFRSRGTFPNRFPVSTGLPKPGLRRGLMDQPISSDAQYYDQVEHGLGKRHYNHSAGGYGPKRTREDPYAEAGYANQLEGSYDPYEETGEASGEYGKALDALVVLEEYAMNQARDNIRKKISTMKKAVQSGVEIDPSELLHTEDGGLVRHHGRMPEFNSRPTRSPAMGFQGRTRNYPTSTAPMRGGPAFARGGGRGGGRGSGRGGGRGFARGMPRF